MGGEKPNHQRALSLVVLSVLIGLAYILICGGAIYYKQQSEIDHQNYEHLKSRVDEMEQRLAPQEKAADLESKPSRTKRQTYTYGDNIESAHVMRTHHGIPSSDIALLYGSPDVLYQSVSNSTNGSGIQPFQFVESKHPMSGSRCKRVMVSAIHHSWCVPYPHSHQAIHKMWIGLADGNNFSYWAKAEWMNEPTSKFQLTDENRGELVVKTSGLYIVTSKVTFMDQSFYYSIAKTSFGSRHSSQISRSLSKSGNQRKSSPTAGHTWELVALEAGDKLTMRISPFLSFIIDRKSMYLAAIKLNGYIG